MKTKAFFEKISKTGKITNEDFTKAIETLPAEHEIPDVFVNLFEDSFLTRERALADNKVYDTIRGEVLDGVKLNIKEYLPYLQPEDQEAIQKEPKAFNQLKMLKDAFGKTVEKVKASAPPSNDEMLKDLKKANEDYVKQITTQKTEFENRQKELQAKFESEKIGMKTDWTLDKKLGEFTFADEYKEVKPHLTKGIIDKIKSENVLMLDENGQIQIHEKLESGATKQKFNGNDPVTLDKLLEEPLKPFLKKNNKDADPPIPGDPSRRQPQTFQPKDPSKMTLREIKMASLNRS